MEANDTIAINAKTFCKIAKMICRIVDHIRKEKFLPEKLAREAFDQIDDLAKEALIAKPRNCDVGTALDQSQRFMDFCRPGNRPPNCEKCKVYPNRMNKYWCQLEWAQLPYEEGGDKQ